MILRLGADVVSPNGTKLGELHRIVYDPETEAVSSIVVTHNALDGREVLVPIGVVDTADDAITQLAVSEEQFNTLEDFEYAHNVAPPPDAEEVDSDLIHDPADVPDVLPVGAATGIESIGYTPVVEEHTYVETGEEVLSRDTVVWATDGEVGRLSQIWINDETRQIESLAAEHGALRKRARIVPAEVIDLIKSEAITLVVGSAGLEDPYNV